MNERRGGAVKPSHIGEGLVRVDVSFASFLCAKEKEERICFFAKERDEPKVLSLRKMQINLHFHSFNRIFADETNSISIEDI